MSSLKLTDLESKGRKIAWSGGGKRGVVEPQALAKLMSDKPAFADGMVNSLGKIWCPLRGVDCKNLGDNMNSLLVLEEYDPNKSIKEYEFKRFPVWVRVFDLPLGLMCRDAGLAIGDIIGEALEVDVGSDGMAVGKFLRIKVRMDISNPIMRGFVLDMDDEQEKGEKPLTKEEQKKRMEDNWCRFEYEFMPDFCYTCGMLDQWRRNVP